MAEKILKSIIIDNKYKVDLDKFYLSLMRPTIYKTDFFSTETSSNKNYLQFSLTLKYKITPEFIRDNLEYLLDNKIVTKVMRD